MGGLGHDTKCGTEQIGTFIVALIAGTACSLSSKLLLSMKSVGITGKEEPFQKPLFQTWGMFLGMCLSLFMHCIYSSMMRARERSKKGYQTVSSETSKPLTMSTYFLLAIPAIFDLAATALCMFGLIYINVSVYQMLRGGAIVFVAILKHFVLGDKLKGYMWFGVLLNVVSIVIVGLVATLSATDDDESGKNPIIGVGLVLAGAFVQSLQYAFEERVMTEDIGAPPLLLIGMEGLWGVIICTFCLYPIVYYLPGDDHGSIEDPFNTMHMFEASPEVQRVFLFYFASIFIYNMFAVLVTFLLNSVWHAILDNFRPITVWFLDLFIYYYISKEYGEEWTPWSWLQLGGLVILLYGTAVYNGSIKINGFDYGESEEDSGGAISIRTPQGMASPNLCKSPLVTRATRRMSRVDDDNNKADDVEIQMRGMRGRTGSN